MKENGWKIRCSGRDYNVKTRILLDTNFNTGEFNDLMYESFSRSCVEDIRMELEEKGYRIERISCTAEEMDMEWLDKLEDMVFGQSRHI